MPFGKELRKVKKAVKKAVKDVGKVGKDVEKKVRKERDKAALHNTRQKRNKCMEDIIADYEKIVEISSEAQQLFAQVDENVQGCTHTSVAAEGQADELREQEPFQEIDLAVQAIANLQTDSKKLLDEAKQKFKFISDAPKTMTHGAEQAAKEALVQIESCQTKIASHLSQASTLLDQIKEKCEAIQDDVSDIAEEHIYARLHELQGQQELEGQKEGLDRKERKEKGERKRQKEKHALHQNTSIQLLSRAENLDSRFSSLQLNSDTLSSSSSSSYPATTSTSTFSAALPLYTLKTAEAITTDKSTSRTIQKEGEVSGSPDGSLTRKLEGPPSGSG